jgi:site-specific DNA-methyltransferase (adenine-specific)
LTTLNGNGRGGVLQLRDPALVKLSKAHALLAEVRDAPDAKRIADMAAAAKVYARKQQLGMESIQYAHGVEIDAKAKLAECLQGKLNRGTRGQRLPSGPGRGKKGKTGAAILVAPVSDVPTLKDLDINPKVSADGAFLLDLKKRKPREYEAVRQMEKTVSEVKRDRRRKAHAAKLRAAGSGNGLTWKVTDDQAAVACHAVITDPPYGILDEPWEPRRLKGFTARWLKRWVGCGTDTFAIFWSQRHLRDGWRWFDEHLAGYTFQQLLVWHYPNNKGPQSRAGFKRTWEPIFLYRRDGCDRVVSPGSGVWGKGLNDFDCHVAAVPQTNFNGADKKCHPAQKPLSAMRWLVNALTLPGEVVADPFAGSGTTGVAAVGLGRSFHGVESDARYLRLARRRINAFGETRV